VDPDENELQREAVALVKQYGHVFIFAPAVRRFFVGLADFLNWYDLQKALK
jgi:hypothetical protein